MLSVCLFVVQADHIRNMQTNEIDMFTTFAEHGCELHLFSSLPLQSLCTTINLARKLKSYPHLAS